MQELKPLEKETQKTKFCLNCNKEELLDWCQTIVDNNPRNNSPKNLQVTSKKANRSFPRTKTAAKRKS